MMRFAKEESALKKQRWCEDTAAKRILKNVLSGLDIDEDAVKFSQWTLELQCLSYAQNPQPLEKQARISAPPVSNANDELSFLGSLSQPEHQPVTIDHPFFNINSPDQYDVVIGNPPIRELKNWSTDTC